MTVRERPIDRARRRSREERARIGTELRRARVASGLSLREVGAGAAMSASQVSRVERALLATVSVDQLARLSVVVGLDLRLATYPGDEPLRDAGHLALIDRFRRRLHPATDFRTEVPLPVGGDRRAWDGYLRGLRDPVGDRASLPVEFETRMDDFQAQTRRLWLKARDAGEPDLLVVVADTRRNRAAIQAAGAAIAERFPVSPRAVLAALAAGRHPGGSGLLLL